MAKFITIPVKSNTPESFKLMDERTEEIRNEKEKAAILGKDPSTLEIMQKYEEKIDKTLVFSISRINIDMIIGYYKDSENDKQTIIKTVSDSIVTNLSEEELDQKIKEA